MIGSLELNFPLPILFLLYIILLIPVIVNNWLKKLHIVTLLHQCLFIMYSKNLFATNSIITRQFFLDNWYLIFTFPSVIQISSINSILLRFNLGRPGVVSKDYMIFNFLKSYRQCSPMKDGPHAY